MGAEKATASIYWFMCNGYLYFLVFVKSVGKPLIALGGVMFFSHCLTTCDYYLRRFDIPTPHKELFFSHATRSMIVDCILRRTHYSTEAASSFGFGKCV